MVAAEVGNTEMGDKEAADTEFACTGHWVGVTLGVEDLPPLDWSLVATVVEGSVFEERELS